ncbi:uncharacterized protein LOC103572816 [Microplitis demolitor]|uniref:uncharacterized protein LOC103572816 n=1 Tax=Microplitis demolitor TaxID=69319 RepID=UPI0004CD814D|nr:uncharacterized protein LOC103572816 [Microplitis demolitor]
MEPVRRLFYNDDYLMCARNWVHYGVAAPVLTAEQKDTGWKRLRAELRKQRERERQPWTEEWKAVVGGLFFTQVEAWKRQWAARVVPIGCARCCSWTHTARECDKPPAELKPFCDECVAFFDGTDVCHGPHGRARLVVRERCMVCCSVRVYPTPYTPHGITRCPKCQRTGYEQLWALAKVPKFTWDPEVIQCYGLN